jgi:hypothetical protein
MQVMNDRRAPRNALWRSDEDKWTVTGIAYCQAREEEKHELPASQTRQKGQTIFQKLCRFNQFQNMKRIAFVLFVLTAGCGLPFMAARSGYDSLVGRPADPNGKGCDYKDQVNNDPNPTAISLLVLHPVFDPVPGTLVPSYCSDTTTCSTGPASKMRYFKGQPMPRECAAYQDQLIQEGAQQRAEEEQRRREALEELLRESPVQSEHGLQNDLALANKLNPTQIEALRDVINGVTLTSEEQKSLAAIDQDQWHAISQLAAFSKWLGDKIKETQVQAAALQEQTEREEDRLQLATYEWLMEQAMARQAEAAQWQAAAAWRQQQCLSKISLGLGCY